MNILEHIEYSNDKANVCIVKKSDKIKQFAVALGQDAVLKKHTTPIPATLIVLKGKIRFLINDQELIFQEMDTFEIPVDVVHEVHGSSNENLFLVTQEL